VLGSRLLVVVAGLLFTAACTGSAVTGSVSPLPDRSPIIPMPRSIQAARDRFQLDAATRVVLSDPTSAELQSQVELLLVPLRTASGLPLPIAPEAHDGVADAMVFRLTPGGDSVQSEGYQLIVTERGVVLSARTSAGLFHGPQTLRQLVPPDIERPAHARRLSPVVWAIPAMKIEDAPRFPYRGILLDVARWFYHPEFIKKVIDLLALYRLNTLQLHLTDDQGWRLEDPFLLGYQLVTS